jgi:hypothetical protein
MLYHRSSENQPFHARLPYRGLDVRPPLTRGSHAINFAPLPPAFEIFGTGVPSGMGATGASQNLICAKELMLDRKGNRILQTMNGEMLAVK